eukprot:859909_1
MLPLARFGSIQRSRWLVFLSMRYCYCETEEWRDIAACSKYQVSTLGRFKNKVTNRLLKLNYDRIKRQNKSPQITLLIRGKIANLRISRTVLSTFGAIDGNNDLYAVHIDGDKYNNTLSNLAWSESHMQYTNIGRKKAHVTLQKNNQTWHFESNSECKTYLQSQGTNISVGTISKLCRDRTERFGFSFLYSDESMYDRNVRCLDGELWKLFHETVHGTKYLVSNQSRIKSVRQNGNEKLMATFLNGGYMQWNLAPYYVHKIVAQNWVPNPNNYSIVDHIDTNIKNNHPSNLRWVADIAENHDNPLSRKNKSIDIKVQQISLIDDTIINVWDRAAIAARELGIQSRDIFMVCRGERKTA